MICRAVTASCSSAMRSNRPSLRSAACSLTWAMRSVLYEPTTTRRMSWRRFAANKSAARRFSHAAAKPLTMSPFSATSDLVSAEGGSIRKCAASCDKPTECNCAPRCDRLSIESTVTGSSPDWAIAEDRKMAPRKKQMQRAMPRLCPTANIIESGLPNSAQFVVSRVLSSDSAYHHGIS